METQPVTSDLAILAVDVLVEPSHQCPVDEQGTHHHHGPQNLPQGHLEVRDRWRDRLETDRWRDGQVEHLAAVRTLAFSVGRFSAPDF